MSPCLANHPDARGRGPFVRNETGLTRSRAGMIATAQRAHEAPLAAAPARPNAAATWRCDALPARRRLRTRSERSLGFRRQHGTTRARNTKPRSGLHMVSDGCPTRRCVTKAWRQNATRHDSVINVSPGTQPGGVVWLRYVPARNSTGLCDVERQSVTARDR